MANENLTLIKGGSGSSISETIPALGRLKELVVRVSATLTIPALVSGLKSGGIPNGLMPSLSLSSTKHNQIINLASGVDILDQALLLKGKSGYVSIQKGAGAAAPFRKSTNYASADIIAATADTYIVTAFFRYSFEAMSESQPENAFFQDTVDETLSLKATLGDASQVYAVPATTAFSNITWSILGVVTPELNFGQKMTEVIARANAGSSEALAEYRELRTKYPLYPEGLVRKLFVANQSSQNPGANSVDIYKDGVSRILEGVAHTFSASATPFALADVMDTFQLQMVLKDGGGTTNIFNSIGEVAQELFDGDSQNIYATGFYPYSAYLGPLGKKGGYRDTLNASQLTTNYSISGAAGMGVKTIALVNESFKAQA